MEKNKRIIMSLSTFFLILAIIVIGIMAYLIFYLGNKIKTENVTVSNLKDQIRILESDLEKNSQSDIQEVKNTEEKENNDNIEAQDDENKYVKNLNESITKELGENNVINIQLSGFDTNNGTGYLSINNKHEAYIYLSTFTEYSSSNGKKIADNVVNAWHCLQGQAAGNSYIIFLKEDGNVSYVRFKTDYSTGGKTIFESEEKNINRLTNISNIIPINGNDANGIGGMGVLFVKTDGTCLPYSKLEDLIKE